MSERNPNERKDMENSMEMKMTDHVKNLLNTMMNDYLDWSHSGPDPNNVRHEMYEEYCNKLAVHEGRKYLKVVSDNSVCAFIVNTTKDKKFQYGDVLKPAGWNAPARNFARCNVFDTISVEKSMRWTGPRY